MAQLLPRMSKGEPDWEQVFNKAMYDIEQGGALGETFWGSIVGNVEDQEDLTKLFVPNREMFPAEIITCDIEDLQATIDSLPRYLNRNYTINVNPGTVVADIMIKQFSGSGTLLIQGASTVAETHNITRVTVQECTCTYAGVYGFNLTATTGTAVGLGQSTCRTIAISVCRMVGGVNTDAANTGVSASFVHNAYFSGNLISNKYTAVTGSYNSHIYAGGLTGSNNNRIFYVTTGARITVVNDVGITGTTRFIAASGGQIFDETHSNGWFVQNGLLYAAGRTISNVAMADLQKTIDSLPKYLDRVVTINVLPGTITSGISISRFSGPGSLIINGSASGSIQTTHNISSLNISYNSIPFINIIGFNLTVTDNYGLVGEYNSGYVLLAWIANTGGVNSGSNSGFFLRYGGAYNVGSCQISNKVHAILAQNGAVIVLSSISGSGNYNAYSNWGGAVISLANAGTIVATNKFSNMNGGLIINPSGTIVGT